MTRHFIGEVRKVPLNHEAHKVKIATKTSNLPTLHGYLDPDSSVIVYLSVVSRFLQWGRFWTTTAKDLHDILAKISRHGKLN